MSVAFDDQAVADYFDDQIDIGRTPEQFARIWIHTHPGDSPEPSSTDEETFARVFGRSDWSVMFILAQGGQTYARLQFPAGPGGSLELPVGIDWHRPFAASDWSFWADEYELAVAVSDWHQPRENDHREPGDTDHDRNGFWPDDSLWC